MCWPRNTLRLKVDKSSEYQPMPPELAPSTGRKPKVLQYAVSAQNLLHTEELMSRLAIYGPITDSFVASVLKYVPEEARDKVVQEQVRIVHNSSHKAIASAMAAVSNLQLTHRDVALGHLQLQDEHIVRAKTSAFHGQSQVGPEPQKFDEKIFTLRDQHAQGVSLVTSRSLRSLSPSHLHSADHLSIKGWDLQLVRKEVSNQSFRRQQSHKGAISSPPHAPQGDHYPGTPAEGRRVLVPRRQLDCLQVLGNEGALD